MTNTPIVDSHHHFWDPTRRDYYWMEGDELASIRKPIGPEDLRPLLAQNNVDRTVIVLIDVLMASDPPFFLQPVEATTHT